MGGVGAGDGDDVQSAAVQLGDGTLGGVPGVAVPRRRVRQHGDAPGAGHGISLPGLRIPAGSRVALTDLSNSTPRSPTSSRIHGR